MAITGAVPKQTEAGGRMSLSAVHSGKRNAPRREIIGGVEGVGKSTFGADAPSPIFLAAEDGIHHLDVASFPEPATFSEVMEAIQVLIAQPHEYRTLVVDTLDWIEPLIWRELCRRNNWQDIESPGYGKGYIAANDEWRKLIAKLDELRRVRGMEIMLLAHTQIKNFANPSGPDFMRYSLKLNERAAALLKEWVDVVAFATFDEFARKEKGAIRAKGAGSGNRIMHTRRTPAWDAKTRYAIPETLPLSYADFDAACRADTPGDAGDLIAEAESLRDELAPAEDVLKKINDTINAARGNSAALAKVVNRLRTLVAEKGE